MKTGKEARLQIREGKWSYPTSGIALGYTQANMVILPQKYAFDFFLFCHRNPKPCPILDVCEAGVYSPILTTKDADIRKDLPKYRVYEHGVPKEDVSDITNIWRDDMVTFLIGCSFTFENALIKEGIEIRHITENKNVPMYITNIECIPAGIFSGPMVVSMRPVKKELAEKAAQITGRYPKVHGSPVHIGDPNEIGIKDINCPDFGDNVTIKEDEVPVFWACGVTPQAALMRVKPEIAITHSPGHMFIMDIKDEELINL